MSSANFKLKRTAAASRGFLATARFSCNELHPAGEVGAEPGEWRSSHTELQLQTLEES